MTNRPEFTPQRIRTLRQRLGLTQEEAGAILGCGPHAFSDYESGLLKPGIVMANLLRLLE